jgi:hypothetical protein
VTFAALIQRIASLLLAETDSLEHRNDQHPSIEIANRMNGRFGGKADIAIALRNVR